MLDNLTNENFLIYAMKCYNSPHCIMSEFENDLKRIKYIKRLIKKYKQKNILRERLILNHIILLNNVFGPEPTSRILFFSIPEIYYDILKTFLSYLDIMPDEMVGINSKNIYTHQIPLELNVTNILLNI